MSAVSHLCNAPASLASTARARSAEPAELRLTKDALEAPTQREVDSVDISAEARAARGQSEDRPIRQDLVNRVRAQIAGDNYLSDDKLDIVADRLLKAISKM